MLHLTLVAQEFTEHISLLKFQVEKLVKVNDRIYYKCVILHVKMLFNLILTLL